MSIVSSPGSPNPATRDVGNNALSARPAGEYISSAPFALIEDTCPAAIGDIAQTSAISAVARTKRLDLNGRQRFRRREMRK